MQRTHAAGLAKEGIHGASWALYPGSSLADLYDTSAMPQPLRAAHRANDRAVMKAYGFAPDMPEAEIVAALMRMYQELAGQGPRP